MCASGRKVFWNFFCHPLQSEVWFPAQVLTDRSVIDCAHANLKIFIAPNCEMVTVRTLEVFRFLSKE